MGLVLTAMGRGLGLGAEGCEWRHLCALNLTLEYFGFLWA